MELIDKQKLLEHINEAANEIYNKGACGYVASGVLIILRDAIEKGDFDDHSTQEEIAKLKEERWEYEKGVSELHGKLTEAINTLEWYGKEIIWIQGRYEGGVFFSQAEDDKGKRARSIISKIET